MVDPTTEIAASIAKPLITKLLDTLLKPAIEVGRAATDPLVDIFTNRFSEYLTRQYVKHSYLPTIVFQGRRPLEELYVPLTVSEQSLHGRETKGNTATKLDRYRKEFLPTLERVLLIDDAGMGKTTVSRYLLVQATKSLITIPVFIELRHLAPDRSVLEVMLSELNPSAFDTSTPKIEKRDVVRLLHKGIFTFFLDGYDEILAKHREIVTIDIKKLIDTYNGNKYLLTSRPEHALASFPSFKIFRIEPLKMEEAFSLIRKYDNDGERATRLIERLKDKSLRGVHEFLQNPLLTTLLYRAYDYKNQIPLKKPVFYRQVFDALYEWHDLTKDGYSTRAKQCGLDIDGFHRILRGLGFISVLKGRVEADTDEMLAWIREARTYAPELKFGESDFLEDAIKAVPVLRREGNAVMWAHKSLSEYFAAQFIVTDAKRDQERICQHLAQLDELRTYSNLLDLLYDMDVAVFGQYFTRELIRHFKAHVSLLKVAFADIPLAVIERRAAVSFVSRVALYNYNSRRPELFTQTLNAQMRELNSEWGLKRPKTSTEDLFEEWPGITVDIGPLFSEAGALSASVRTLTFAHPLRTIFDILLEKKHQLVLQRAFFKPDISRARIVGLRKNSRSIVGISPASLWNSAKNFESTTSALMRLSTGILDVEKVESTLREIDQGAQHSETTMSLLRSLNKI